MNRKFIISLIAVLLALSLYSCRSKESVPAPADEDTLEESAGLPGSAESASPPQPVEIETPPVAANEQIAKKLAQAIDYYLDGLFVKGLAITDELIMESGLTASDSIAIYEVKSIITYAQGVQYKNNAYGYLDRISDIGHCLIPLPREIWPTELRDRWYQLCKMKNMLACPQDKDEPDIQTIAIMEFDNFSTKDYQEELGDLSKALADFFEFDFSRFSSLKVVERDKIDYILREIIMIEEGKVDKATAARVGKILGAQLMVFGSISQYSANKARMTCRVVKVETSEIIISADREGKPNFVEMEKELVKDLAEQLNLMVSKDTYLDIDKSGTSDMDAAKLYSMGLKYLDKYNYKMAYDYFKRAYDKDQSFVEAKRKMAIYRPLIG